MSFFENLSNISFAKAKENPCDSCAGLRAGAYDAKENYTRLRQVQNDIPTATTEEKGKLYTEMAELYLRNAVRHADNGEANETKLLTAGSDLGRQTPDSTGKPRGYDGALNALGLAVENGGDATKIRKLSLNAKELYKWSDDQLNPRKK